jgi:hypothetical protein
MAIAPNELPERPRNYLLRVLGVTCELRFVLQDLHTGECRRFATAGALRRFLATPIQRKRLR